MKRGQRPDFLAGLDVDALREKIRRPPFDAMFRRVADAVHAAAEADAREPRLRAGGWCHSQYFTPQVVEAAFLHRLTGDPAALAHVERQIAKLARVWADPPRSFERELDGFRPGTKATSYFSSAHTCLAASMCRAALSAEARRTLLDLVRRHFVADNGNAEYILTHYNAGHNAVTTHVVSAALCALAFGEESGHPGWRRAVELGRDACELHAYWSYDEAGVPFEGPMYAYVTVEWVFLFADWLRRLGGPDLLAEIPKLARVAEAAALLMLPDGSGVPGFQDSREVVTRRPMRWLPLTARAYCRPGDLALFDVVVPPDQRGLWEILWWDGSSAPRPLAGCGLPAAFVGRGAAVAAFRSSWAADATFLTVHGQGRSRAVPDHTHADAGHFTIHAAGELLAWDTGYFNFDEDQHNVILIDGRPFAPTTRGNQHAGRFDRVSSRPWLDAVEVECAGAKGCIWARRLVLFVRGAADADAYVVVMDNVNADNRVHRFAWQLHAPPGRRVEIAGPAEASVSGERGRLDCTFALPRPEDFPACPHTFRLYADECPSRAVHDGSPVSHPRLVGEQEGPNGGLLAVVAPARAGAARRPVRVVPAPRLFQAFVETGDHVDQVLFAPDHAWIRLGTASGITEAAVIRRSRRGRVIDTWTLDGSINPHP